MNSEVKHLDKSILLEELKELRKKEEELEKKILEIDSEVSRLKHLRMSLKSELNKVKKRIAELTNLIEKT